MIHAFLAMLLSAVPGQADKIQNTPDTPVIALNYSGSISPVGRTSSMGNPTKTFDLSVWASGTDNNTRLFWTVEETGAGSWSWPEQYGRFVVGKESDGRLPAVLHLHAGTHYPLDLPDTWFSFPGRLSEGKEWTDKRGDWRVDGVRRIKGRDCKRIRRSFSRGREQSVWVESKTGIVVAAEQSLFMGRGDRFQLKMELDSQRALTTEQQASFNKVTTALLRTQQQLQRDPGEHRSELSKEQLNIAVSGIKALAPPADLTPLKDLVSSISRRVKLQQRRQSELQSLGANLVGKPAPKFELQSIAGTSLDSKDRAGKTVVLHFWEYASEPLEEPYGQVGYLDFLNNKRSKQGVQVYGVAVNERLSDPAQRSATLRSIRKLREFMNLSYELAIDSGDVLKSFGDPREIGAKLPLWIVIDTNGKVAHYHAGLHEVDRRAGLKTLDEVVGKTLSEK